MRLVPGKGKGKKESVPLVELHVIFCRKPVSLFYAIFTRKLDFFISKNAYINCQAKEHGLDKLKFGMISNW